MGSNVIVVGTLIFLLVSAVLLVFMVYSMNRNSHMTYEYDIDGVRLTLGFPATSPSSIRAIQDFIYAKAEIIYNEKAYALNSDFYKIGRDPDCNLRISDESVSQLQCAIEYHDNVFMLSDLNSKYGTYVNGEQAKEPVELHDGDEIRMGYAVMTFKRRNERKADDGGAENPSQTTE